MKRKMTTFFCVFLLIEKKTMVKAVKAVSARIGDDVRKAEE